MLKFNLICLLFLCFYIFPANPGDLEKDAYAKRFKGKKVPKFFHFDEYGNLIIDATVPGESPPIVLDSKKYYPACTTNVYFSFIFTIKNQAKSKSKKKKCNTKEFCDEGMTLCYEGQMAGEHMRAEYNIQNLGTEFSKELTKACIAANKNKATPGVRALHIAVKRFEDLSEDMIKRSLDDKDFKAINEFGCEKIWYFFVISSTFFDQKYFFIVPKDGTLVLQIGGPKSLGIDIIDSGGKQIPAVTFKKGGKDYGTLEPIAIPSVDMSNGGNLRKKVGLWMLYLDFKTNYYAWQAMSTVNPDRNHTCHMKLEIRGNRMRPCRSYYENIAIFEAVNAQTNITYTSVVGSVKTQSYGEEDATETAKRWKKEKMQSEATKDITQTAESNSDIEEEELQEISSKSREKTLTTIDKGEHEISLNANPEKATRDQVAKDTGLPPTDGVNARVAAKASWEKKKFSSDKTTDENIKSKIDRDTNTMFSDTTRAQTMMEGFKSTSGAVEGMSQSQFMQSTNAFTSWESVDISIQLPPNTRLVIKQLMYDCDGNLVKMPYVYYSSDGTDILNLKDNNAGVKRSQQNRWGNQTLGAASIRKKIKEIVGDVPIKKKSEDSDDDEYYD